MKITCAISPQQLEKLYKHVTLSMQEARSKNKTFDPNVYMTDLFKKIKAKSGTDTAVKFLQPVPLMIFKAYTTIPNYVNDVVVDVDPILKMNRLFTDELTGMRNVLNAFAPGQNQSILKEAIFQTELLAVQTPLTEIEKIEPIRFEPINVFSGTLQQFIPVDLQKLDENLIQRSSQERAIFYKVFDRLSAEGETEGVTSSLIYQGTKLKLKPMRLIDMDQNDLDAITKKYLVKALSIRRQGTAKEGVIKPEDIIMTVLSDENGNLVRFDEQGNISQQGSIVYQSMRNVVLKNGKYKIVDNYGNETFKSAVPRIADKFEVSIEAANEIFQKQLKALYKLRKDILSKAKEERQSKPDTSEIPNLSITGFSAGIESDFTQKRLELKHLPLFNLTDAVRTIEMIKEAGKFQATIMLENERFKINRPLLDKATAEKIADVLTDKNLSYRDKKSYVQQFLAENTSPKNTRLKIRFLDTNKSILVAYSESTSTQDPFRKFDNLDLAQAESRDQIVDALLNATSSKDGRTFPISIKYNTDLLNSNSYLDYSNGKLIKAEDTYSTYLTSLDGGGIDLSSANTEEVFNQYINFAIPSPVIKQLNEVEQQEDSEVRKRKDAIVDYIKSSDTDLTVVIEKVRSGTFENKPYVNAFFKSPVDNSETKIRVTGEVKEGDTVQLVIEDVTTKDMYIPDVLSAVQDGKKVGKIEETDFGKGEAPRDEYYKQLFKNRQKKSTDEQIDDATTNENTSNPNDGGIASRFGFDRSGKLPADPGTKEQNKKAMEWWAQSDLSKYLDLETGVNIVNSDAFAQFVSYGSVLAGKYGKISIAKSGTDVDLYHEAWHGFTQLFLSPKERKSLYQEVKRSLKGADKLSYFEIEEYLAEEFRKYAKNPKPKKSSPKRNSIFRRILNFLKKLFGSGYTTNPLEIRKVQEMFEALYYNKGLNKYTPSIDNVQFDVLERNIGITLPGTNTQVLSRQESLLIKDSMDSIISDIVDDINESIKDRNPDQGVALKVVLDPKKKSVLYGEIKKRLEEKVKVFQEQVDNLDPTTENQFKIDQLNEKIRVLGAAIGSYGSPTAGTVKFHIDNSTYKILADTYIEDQLTEDENKTVEDSERFADKKVGDKSLLEFAGKETLYMLKSLHQVKNGKTVENELGFKKLADFRLTWNNIVRTIAGESDPQVMYDKLKKASGQYEPFKQLIESKLANPSISSNVFDFKATTSFWQDFNKSRVPYIQLTLFPSDKGVIAKVLNASTDTKNILRNFNTKFKSDQDNPYVTLDPSSGITRLDIEKVLSDFGKNGFLNGTRAVDFARAIGIYVDDIQTIRDELNSTVKGGKTVPNTKAEEYGLSYMYRALFDVYNNISKAPKPLNSKLNKELQELLLDPVSSFFKGISKELTGTKASKQYTQLNRLAALQGRFGEAANIFGVLNAEGNVVYEYIENNTASTRTRSINNADKFSQLIDSDMNPMSYLSPDKNTFTSKSVLLRSLFNLNKSATDGNSIDNAYIELFLDSGTSREFGDGTNTGNLDENGKFLQEFHMMLLDGTQEFIRAASKKSAFGLRFRGSIKDKLGRPINEENSNLYVSLETFTENYTDTVNMINEQFMLGYLASEANRIHKFINNREEFKNYTGFNRPLANGRLAGESFTIFDDILGVETVGNETNDLRQELYDIIESKKNEVFDLEDYLAKNPALTERIKAQMNVYFQSKITDVYTKISQPNALISESVLDLVDNIESLENKKKFLAAAYYYNSWIHNFETANLLEGDLSQYNHEKEELSKRSPGTKSGGKTFRVDSAAQKFINGKSFQNGTYAKLANKKTKFRYDGTMVTAIMQDIERDSQYSSEIEKALRSYYDSKIADKDLVEKLVADDMSKYQGMEEGDGQGYITFDAYRALKFLENDWSYEQEQLFNKIAKGESVTAKELTDLFPPYKLFYSGSIKEAKLPVNSMHKFSLMPLIPSVMKGGLESLHNQMINKGIAYSLFATGSKTSHISSNGTADVIYQDDVQKDLKEDIEFTPNTIYVDYLKNVTSVPKKFKNKTIFSTQFRKLILKDLYNRGIITDPKAKDVAEKYGNLIDSYMEVLEEQLLDEIGYKKVGNKYVGNIENFLNLVQRELGRRDMPEHQIAFVGENVNKTLKTDLSFHFKAGDIEKMIVGLIEKRLIKQRVKGESLVQVSSAMTNGMWGTSTKFTNPESEEQIRKYLGSNNLPFYTKKADGTTAAMKVAIAMQGDFTNLYNVKDKDGKSIKVFNKIEGVDDAGNSITTSVFNEKATLANLNRLIKDEEWLDANDGENRKLITMTAVRIPVQGINSMEFMEVHEFLSPEASNIIIPPSEIVAKSGSDFDIDKLNVFMPNIDAKGKLVKQGESLSSKKKGIENEVIETMAEILSLESNYVNLVRPNSTFLVKEEIADKIGDRVSEYDRYANINQGVKLNKKGKKIISPSQTIDPLYNVQKHAENMTGKRVLGLVAIENALSVIINASKNGKMPKTYKQEGSWNDKLNRRNLTNIDRAMRLFLPHNKFPDGSISISDVDAQDGNNIGELYSQILNGFVDIEKDPWVFNIQGNYEIMPTLLFLIKAGVPVKSAVSFVSNPFVREYAKKQRELKSSYAAQPEDARFVRYKAAGQTIEELALPENRPGSLKPKGNNLVHAYITVADYYDVITKRMRGKSEFTTAELREVMTGDPLADPKTNNIALNMFLHFLEMEKQIAGLKSLKLQSNPDTTRSKSVQELIIREANYENLSDITKLDQELVRQMRDESILSSFRIGNLIKDIVNPVFSFRNNDKITDFLSEKLKTIGGTRDEKSLVITRFKDSVMDYIFQNYQNSFVDSNGELTSTPESYLGFEVKARKNITNGVAINKQKETVFIDNAQIQKDFDSKIYLSQEIKKRGLRPVSKDIFRNIVEYKKFVVAREYLRAFMPKESIAKDKDFVKFKTYFKESQNMSEQEASDQAYEAFLNREALFDSFNRATIMGTGDFSYSQTILDLINDNPALKNKYDILSQFYIPKQGGANAGIKTLSLKNIKEVRRESELGDTYYSNIKELSDPTIMKVPDVAENLRLSRMFAKLALVSIYQNGVGGYNTQSIIDVLPYTNFLDVMNVASDKFLDKQLNEKTLNYIFDKLFTFTTNKGKEIFTTKNRFVDFTVSPKDYKDSTVQVADVEELSQEDLSENIKPVQTFDIKSKTYDGLLDVKNLKDNQDTVFGSNQFGFHGGGTAGILYANDPRAYKKQDIKGKGLRVEVGKARGFQTGTEGSSYAIQTVTNWKLPMDDPKRQVPKDQIVSQVKEMYDYYRNNPTREAFVLYTTQGKNLNGYTPQEMADMFSAAGSAPTNVIFNKEFRDLMYTKDDLGTETVPTPTDVKIRQPISNEEFQQLKRERDLLDQQTDQKIDEAEDARAFERSDFSARFAITIQMARNFSTDILDKMIERKKQKIQASENAKALIKNASGKTERVYQNLISLGPILRRELAALEALRAEGITPQEAAQLGINPKFGPDGKPPINRTGNIC